MVSIILDALFFTIIVCCMVVMDFLALGTVLGHTIKSTNQESLYMVIHGGLVLEPFNFVCMKLVYVTLCALACPLPHPRETQKRCGTARRLLLGMKRCAMRCGLPLLVHNSGEPLPLHAGIIAALLWRFEIQVSGFQETFYNLFC